IQDVFSVGQEIAASRAAFTGRNELLIRPIRVHDEDLVALVALSSRLEDKPLAVGRPIGLRVLTAVCKLADIAEVFRFGGQAKSAAPNQPDGSHGCIQLY